MNRHVSRSAALAAAASLSVTSLCLAGEVRLEWEAPPGQCLSGFFDHGTVYSRALFNDFWDMEGDGIPELALESRTQGFDEEASAYDGQTKLLKWSYPMPGAYGFSPTFAGFVDVDGDGQREAIVHIWRAETQEPILRIIDWQTDTILADIAGQYAGIADVDVDGLPELLVQTGQPYTLQVWGYGDEDVSGFEGDLQGAEVRSAFPNPFSREASVDFGLETAQSVRVTVYDLNGRVVSSLLDGVLPAGGHTVRWDATDGSGKPVANGVYLMSVESDGVTDTRKMVFLR